MYGENFMNTLDKKSLTVKLNKLISESKTEEERQEFTRINNYLNGKSSISVTSRIEKFKYFFKMLKPTYRQAFEENTLKTANNDTLKAITKNLENIFNHKILKGEDSEFGYVFRNALDIKFGVEFKENSIKRYPINLNDKIMQEEKEKLLTQMAEKYLYEEDASISEVAEQYKRQQQNEIEAIKDKAKPCEIEPYYGTKEFMQCRTQYMRECMVKLLNSEQM
jgi:hypothetical protein